MDRYVDLETWPRRDAYQLFSRGYLPCFSVTTPLDVTELLRFTKREGLSLYRALVYTVTRAMNELELLDGSHVRDMLARMGEIMRIQDEA